MGLGVLKVVEKVLSNKRVQGALCATPAPAINGQDQRLDVLIAKVDRLCEATEAQNEMLAEYLRWRVEQLRPPATMELLPEPDESSLRGILDGALQDYERSTDDDPVARDFQPAAESAARRRKR